MKLIIMIYISCRERDSHVNEKRKRNTGMEETRWGGEELTEVRGVSDNERKGLGGIRKEIKCI